LYNKLNMKKNYFVCFLFFASAFNFFLPAAVAEGNSSATTDKKTPASHSEEPYFVNVSSVAGLSDVSVQNPVWVDINGDGYADLIVTGNDGGLKTLVFLNEEKDGRRFFKDFTEESGLNADPDNKKIRRGASFFTAGDVNNDGYTDLFSAVYCEYDKPAADKDGKVIKDAAGNTVYEKKDDGIRSQIYLNDGKGHFHTPEGKTVFPPETTSSATFLDYDRDGNPDLFVGNWYKEYGISLLSYVSRLYRGKGDGTFTDVTEAAGLMTRPSEGEADSSRPVYGVTSCDWNGDGLADILVSVYGRQANRLWKNNGDGTFVDTAPATGFDGDDIRDGKYPAWLKRAPEKEFRSHGNTFSAACADYDNDGDEDVFLAEITHSWAGAASDRSSLLVNSGAEKGWVFERYPDILLRVHQSSSSWNQGDMRATWADFDNDGRLDLLLASGDYNDGQYLRLFRQVKPLVFEDITERAGFGWESSGGISVADYDNDGRLDVIAGKSWMRMPKEKRTGRVPAPALFHNQIRNGNHWLSVKLEGSGAGGTAADCVGTKVRVVSGDLIQTREAGSSHGHMGLADEKRLHFGLAGNKTADITVYWNGHTQIYRNIPADRFVAIKEGSDTPSVSVRP